MQHRPIQPSLLLRFSAWAASLVLAGEESKRAMQLWRWMYADPPAAVDQPLESAWASSLDFTLGKCNGFSRAFCEKANPVCSLEGSMAMDNVSGHAGIGKSMMHNIGLVIV
jgi:23S rRNA (adenine2503-C2)-methyltransferase